MKFNEWPVLDLEAEGWPAGSVVAVPVLTTAADMVAAEALRLGLDRGVFIQAAIGAGLAIIAAKGPATVEPTFPDAPEPGK